MLRRQSELYRSLLLVGDAALVSATWLGAYWLRFHIGIPAPLGVPPLDPYLVALALLVPTWWWVFRSRGLYSPRRTDSLLSELGAVFAAATTVIVLVVVASFFVRSYFFSRGVILLFYILALFSVALFRLVAREILFAAHRRGRHLSQVLVVGAGPLAEQLIDRVQQHPEAGLRAVGVLAADARIRRVRGVPVLGDYRRLRAAIAQTGARQVVIALPREDGHRLDALLDELDGELVDVRLVPDVMHAATLRSSVEDFDGLPVIGLHDSPLLGWAAIQKRLFDIGVSALLLAFAAPLLALVAVAVRVTSGRPVLYVQERMGLDGRLFRMVKFRTMVPDAEREGPVWAREEDPRTTPIGSFLRRSGLDELPQLWNVLRGDMSLVGPRPERPIFIEQFRREVPGYMLRHKVKAGLTGWAQVHRWRGDTSLHERLEHDLYYIRNWSLGLDMRILIMTLWRASSPT